jgi:hypothetical protein
VWGADLIPGPSPEGEGGVWVKGRECDQILNILMRENVGCHLKTLCPGQKNLFVKTDALLSPSGEGARKLGAMAEGEVCTRASLLHLHHLLSINSISCSHPEKI